jgi:hypothetical protein
MNPNSSGENQPQFEAAPSGSPEETSDGKVAEKGQAASPENSPQRVVQASQAASTIALPGQDITVGTPDDSATDDSHSNSAVAADTDRIEKQWIDKAKAVVAQTQDDPYEQKNAISHVKADYVKKRFNKTIKTDDPVTK